MHPQDQTPPSPTEPMGMSPNPEPQRQRSLLWNVFFWFLGIANLIAIVGPIVLIAYAINATRHGIPGTEYIGLIIVRFIPISIGILILNVVAIIIYLAAKRPRKLAWAVGCLVIALSMTLLFYLGSSNYRNQQASKKFHEVITKTEALALIKDCKITGVSRQEDKLTLFTKHPAGSQDPREYMRFVSDTNFSDIRTAAQAASASCGRISVTGLDSDNVQQDISVSEATKLLNECKLIGFYYTQQGNNSKSGVDAENSTTGIILAFKNNPIRIHIADRLIPQLVPIARTAQKTCPDLQFWHDGRYEQRDADGAWK